MRIVWSHSLGSCLVAGLAAASIAGPVFITKLPAPAEDGTALSTEGAIIIDGLSKKTGKGTTDWQSARILLSGAGTVAGEASGKLSTTYQWLELTKGWAYVSVAPASSDSSAAVPTAAVVWFRPWVFVGVNGIGAGAEGTKFLTQLDPGADAADTSDDIVRVFADSDNTKQVLLVMPCPNDDGSEGSKELGVYPGKVAQITVIDGVYCVNGKSIQDYKNGDAVGEKPDAYSEFLKDAAAEMARAKF